ncbi:hypothetical protein BDW02DRAFT_566708 [Decorospora gaudefroyi]|uniref:Uncharacterized protein n=1 Tax=Decorospora gaudefroyi TaxID=184978 RepID=A0A6A5KNK1_9PLEO|nr:hypothetical protein BDW02DRAFT_566708 [Decorospora gaudefroyi]
MNVLMSFSCFCSSSFLLAPPAFRPMTVADGAFSPPIPSLLLLISFGSPVLLPLRIFLSGQCQWRTEYSASTLSLIFQLPALTLSSYSSLVSFPLHTCFSGQCQWRIGYSASTLSFILQIPGLTLVSFSSPVLPFCARTFQANANGGPSILLPHSL